MYVPDPFALDDQAAIAGLLWRAPTRKPPS